MDKDLLRELAIDIINNEVYLNWKFYLILIAIIILGNVISSFLWSYSRKRGEHLATKADLEEIVKQQKVITETTELIKNEVEHSLWKKKEYNTLRRHKLEELLTLVYEQQEWLDREKNHYLFNGRENTKNKPINHITMIYKLYFPELNESISSLITANTEYSQWLIDGRQEILEKQKTGQTVCTSSHEHLGKYSEKYKSIIESISHIENSCSELMAKLLNS